MLSRGYERAQTIQTGSSGQGKVPDRLHRALPRATVQVLSMKDIAPTLNAQGRDRGLWFDRDMIRQCGRKLIVLQRVERILDDATGQIREFKKTSHQHEGAEASGRFLRFSAH